MDESTLSTDNAVLCERNGVYAYATRLRFYDNEASAGDRSYKRDVFSHYRVRFYCEAAYFCAPFTAIVVHFSGAYRGLRKCNRHGESSRDYRSILKRFSIISHAGADISSVL